MGRSGFWQRMTPALTPARPMLRALAGPARGMSGLAMGALDLVLPPTCIGCGARVRDAGGLCGACWGRLAFIERPYCERLGIPFAYEPFGMRGAPRLSPEAMDHPPAFDRARAAVKFGGVAQDLVHGLKYGDRLDLARPMARLMLRAGNEVLAEADLVIPVPLHAVRLWRRRFNQAAVLAQAIAAASARPCRTDLLKRIRATHSQVTLSRLDRRANVAGAFAVPAALEAQVCGRRILLVDDVLTTGATLDACARTLRRAGATHVDALTFARVVETL